MASQVGSAEVALFPTFKGMRKKIVDQVTGAGDDAGGKFNKGFTKSASDTGASAGRGFSKSFSISTSDLGVQSIKQLESTVASASRAVSKSRLSELDAIGKVRVAQTQLTEATSKYGDTSSHVISSQERLAKAQRGLGAIQDALKGQTSKLSAAQGALKAATDDAANSTVRSSGRFSAFASNLGAGFQKGMGVAVDVVSKSLQIISGIAVAGAAAVGIAVGATLVSGFQRLGSIETAEAKLKALGHTAADISSIMANATEAVTGTQYSLSDAATIAASAVAAGVKPGKDLTKYLRLVANAAAISGSDLSDMGTALNNVRTVGAAYNDTLQILAQRGIPIYTLLAKQMGVTTDQVKDLASQGKVSADTFESALRGGIGDAAIEVGKTTEGAFENMKTAIARFGAGALEGVYPVFAKVFGGVQAGLDKLGSAIKPVADDLGPKFLATIQPTLDKLGPLWDKFVGKIIKLVQSPQAQAFFKQMGDAIGKAGDSLIKFLPSLGKFVLLALKFGAVTVLVLTNGIAPLIDGIKVVTDVINGFGTAITNGSIGGWVTDTLGMFMDFFANTGGMFVDFFTNTVGMFVDFFTNTVGMFSDWVSNTRGMFSDFFGNTIGMFVDFVTNTVGMIADWVAGIVGMFTDFWAPIVDAFAPIISGVANIFSTLWQILTTIVGGIVTTVVGFFVGLWTQIVAVVSTISTSVIGFFVGLWTSVVGAVSSMVSGVIGFFVGLWTSIVGVVSQMVANVIGFFAGFVASVVSTVSGFVGTVVGFFTGLWGQAVSATQNGIADVVNTVGGIAGKVLGAIGDLGSTLYNSGKSLIDGFINGIKDMIGKVGDAAGSVLDWAKSFFPHSPAKRGPLSGAGWRAIRKSGQAVADQFALGLEPTAVNGAMSALLTIPKTATTMGRYSAGSAASSTAAQARGGNVYIDTIVAPDQNPVVSGRIMGREFLRVKAG